MVEIYVHPTSYDVAHINRGCAPLVFAYLCRVEVILREEVFRKSAVNSVSEK